MASIESRKDVEVWVGTYTEKLGHVDGRGEGLVPVLVNTATGALQSAQKKTVELTPNPAYMAMSPCGRNMYAVTEQYDVNSSIHSLHFDEAGELVLKNSRDAKGTACCHVAVSRNNNFVVAANYMSGSVVVYARNEDGTLGACVAHDQYTGGAMTNPDRQEQPHAHMVCFDPSHQYLYVPDLGANVVRQYRFDPTSGKITRLAVGDLQMRTAGCGPRHMVFHPTLPVAYVLNELLSTVTTCAFDTASGALTIVAETTTLPPGVPVGINGESFCAAIRIRANGKTVYCSNRLHDTIARFDVNVDGALTLAELTPTGGKTPRDILTVGSDDSVLVVANQDSSTLTSFLIDEDSGALTATGQSFAVHSPAALCSYTPQS
eukprot:m.158776 g.158776  ORF g.158776 m.158776 type:complete len:376 (-) comp17981_c0_seq1:46-1173(-)